MKLYLLCDGSGPWGTFGQLYRADQSTPDGVLVPDNFLCHTVERPWLNNQPFSSCVPRGTYKLLWLPTTTSVPECFEGHTWYLDGPLVSAHHGSSKPRSRCCFHKANRYDQLYGCIAPGLSRGMQGGVWSVDRSGDAMKMLYRLLGPGDHELVRQYAPTQ